MPLYNDGVAPTVTIVGGGLAGSECAYQLAKRGIGVVLTEMRPESSPPRLTKPVDWQSWSAATRSAATIRYTRPGC